ncbi:MULTISPECIES: acyl-CoA dehydrogenase family protein [unclassified Microbacterium]|uniref:acyl-CoA dehydrogenase family protein n=1 Tax=Microbacterium TaxID=33882 RepID=UPI003BA09D22
MDRERRHAELAERYLPDDLLERFRERAAVYDRENRFFDEDLEELRAVGYLTLFVPEELGGAGLGLGDVSRLQQRLAGAAPATALAINMHLMCTGVVQAMLARGDRSLAWVLEEAMAGEIFAFGISEPSNDWVLQGSNTVAEPDGDGGYRLTGVKIFTSLSPVWTRLIVHGRDGSVPDDPVLVYGFVDRDAPGITVSDQWDVLGMRASQSRATILDGVPLRADRVARRIPAGRHPDLLVFAITSAFQLLVGSVYAGIARRALDLGAEALKRRRSAKTGTTFAEVPEARVRLADAHMAYLAVPAQLEAYTRDFDELVEHGAGWPLRLVSARLNASHAARRAAETALLCAGGSGFDNGSELSRLYRDATAGLFHPPSADAARPMYAAALLDDD